MEEKEIHKKKQWKQISAACGPAPMYGLGILGVAVYYLQHSFTFWDSVIGIIKAIFWPGFLLYRVFELLKM